MDSNKLKKNAIADCIEYALYMSDIDQCSIREGDDCYYIDGKVNIVATVFLRALFDTNVMAYLNENGELVAHYA